MFWKMQYSLGISKTIKDLKIIATSAASVRFNYIKMPMHAHQHYQKQKQNVYTV